MLRWRRRLLLTRQAWGRLLTGWRSHALSAPPGMQDMACYLVRVDQADPPRHDGMPHSKPDLEGANEVVISGMC